jgi:hypothetical protein
MELRELTEEEMLLVAGGVGRSHAHTHAPEHEDRHHRRRRHHHYGDEWDNGDDWNWDDNYWDE